MIKVKRLRTIFQKKNLKLKLTAGEILRDNIVEGATEVAYLAGNSSETVINVIDKATMLVGGGEAARALGNILVKTGQDVARGDTVCRGLGCISVTCEAVALCCSVLKFIPCRDTIYGACRLEMLVQQAEIAKLIHLHNGSWDSKLLPLGTRSFIDKNVSEVPSSEPQD